MESKEREELIRRYCKLSAVPMPAILTTFAVPLVWLVLVMTDEIRFNSTGIYYPGLSVCLGLTAAMLGLFLWSLITLVKGMDKPEWKEIEGDRTVRTAGTSWLSQNLSAGARRRAYRAAKQYGIQVPAENGVTVMVVLLPLLILCGSFVPEYLNSIAEQKQIIQIVGAAETRIKTVFEKQNYRVIVTDPSVTQTHEYSVICTRETSDDAYTSLYLNRYGQIESVHYHLLADTSLDQTDQLARFNTAVQEMNGLLKDSGVEARPASLLDYSALPDSLAQPFLKDTDNVDMFQSAQASGLEFSLGWYVTDRSENDPAYLYFTVEPD